MIDVERAIAERGDYIMLLRTQDLVTLVYELLDRPIQRSYTVLDEDGMEITLTVQLLDEGIVCDLWTPTGDCVGTYSHTAQEMEYLCI